MSELNKQALFWAGHAVSLALEEMRTDDSLSKPERIARRAITAYFEADGAAEELHEINTRLARVLTDTANALKGEPEPHVMHSWHDLAEVATELIARLEQAEQQVQRVHELSNKLSWSPNLTAVVQRYRDALDGEHQCDL